MIPADGVIQAAVRWLHLLRRSSIEQASALIRSDSRFTDLSQTQYASALDWLEAIRIVDRTSETSPLLYGAGFTENQLKEFLFMIALEAAAPPWLSDADLLVGDPEDLPGDAWAFAESLALPEQAAARAVRQIHGRIDLAKRAEVGAAGELALVRLLEAKWAGSTNHVALEHDGLGYDIAVSLPAGAWHLEIKTTTRHGRLLIHLSRQEYEVSLTDESWRMVIVGLDANGRIGCLATAKRHELQSRAPLDQGAGARWESTRYELAAQDLHAGVGFLCDQADCTDEDLLLSHGSTNEPTPFVWMP